MNSSNSTNTSSDLPDVPDNIRSALANVSSSSESSEVDGSSVPPVRVELTNTSLERLTQQANYWMQWFDSSGSDSNDATNNGPRAVRPRPIIPRQVIVEQPGSWPRQIISMIRPLEPGEPECMSFVMGQAEDSREALNFADSETESWDSSTSGLKSDSELELDKWPCHQCGTPTSAVSRYCLRCFQVRRNWLPKRPKFGSKHGRKRKYRSYSSDTDAVVTEGPDTVSRGQDEHEFLCPEPKRLKLDNDDEVLRKKKEKMEGSQIPENFCDYCCVREKDAAFVHNHIAHRCCCFPCADRILKRTGKCPICRERILRVVKMVVV